MKIGTKLLLILVLIGLAPIAIVGVWSYFGGADTLRDVALAHLQSVSVIQQNRVEHVEGL